jgi:hypothetical protein
MKRKLLVYMIVIVAVTGFAITCLMLHLTVWWGIAAVLPGIGILALEHRASRGSKDASIALRSMLSLTIVGAVLIWFPMIIMVIGNALFDRAPGHYLNWIAVVVWPVGWAAFRFKQFNQKHYGIVEIVVGVLTALGTTVRGTFGPTQGTGSIGCDVRRIEGIWKHHRGREEERRDRDECASLPCISGPRQSLIQQAFANDH